MRAAFYEARGPARDVLRVGDVPDPHPGDGEVRIRIARSGINPGDVKKRAPWLGNSSLAYPRVIPHSDGAGVVDEIGKHVTLREGARVWCFGAQSYRAFGTAAEYVVLPESLVVPLPAHASFAAGACLGIPGITAHRLVFQGGAVTGKRVLVQGGAGAVGALAVRLARAGGAEVFATVRNPKQAEVAHEAGAAVVAPGDLPPSSIDRIIEVAFAANIEMDEKLLAVGGCVAAYATNEDEPKIPFWPLLFKDMSIYLCGSDDVPLPAKRAAAKDLDALLAAGWSGPAIAEELPLDRIADAHDLVDRGAAGRVVLAIS